MKRTFLGTLAAIAVAVPMAVPAGAQADAGPGCRAGEGVVNCAKRLLAENGPVVTEPCEGQPLTDCAYALLRDLCYACDPEPIVARVVGMVNETCEALIRYCDIS